MPFPSSFHGAEGSFSRILRSGAVISLALSVILVHRFDSLDPKKERRRESESVRFDSTCLGVACPSEAVHVRMYNGATKAVAAPHVSHYDFSALLLIKMQIYRGRGAREIGR